MNMTAVPDRRYRILVLMNRTDRPRYYTFHCPFCSKPLAEITNSTVSSLSDIIDMNNTASYGVGVQCLSRQCRDIWYYFNMNAS